MHSRKDLDTQALYNPEDLELILNIQMVSRLIQDQSFRLLGEGPRHQNPLAFAAGERVEFAVGHSLHSNQLQRLPG